MNKTGSPSHIFWLLLCMVALLLIAVLDMPYGYYQFLRLALSGTLVYSLYSDEALRQKDVLKWSLIGVAILYNPILPVHLTKEIWAMLNLAAAGIAGFAAYTSYRASRF
ncbi:MAG: hypothetical protein COY40_03165 [Alphaproteobacteria bacterium CG_4_10_14_0_8_um_filter_53_9]|nr:MAG: hypothetical protein COY40_03165 [Alphaproteobacteria bacterium CG_4_10_14_0_8_um_filter_53_9]